MCVFKKYMCFLYVGFQKDTFQRIKDTFQLLDREFPERMQKTDLLFEKQICVSTKKHMCVSKRHISSIRYKKKSWSGIPEENTKGGFAFQKSKCAFNKKHMCVSKRRILMYERHISIFSFSIKKILYEMCLLKCVFWEWNVSFGMCLLWYWNVSFECVWNVSFVEFLQKANVPFQKTHFLNSETHNWC